ncbi:MobC family plasmid mobilization relaxosome protein [Yinghuangia sp. ASG 101]|uniref:plasmid mobilization relaxosome protein MobC n=1 Tax=Yinghuangia sp. ASG 101 TaxID=2896848 RepID=UPI001E3D47F8|nr:plasmid mobilization relaxosome protein MobC [Yinghuangia sp. ASG 101]UGQ14853.1 MobC family plasmid mobilization relaxosome protein [Yinghuangia sp. ASG 101]
MYPDEPSHALDNTSAVEPSQSSGSDDPLFFKTDIHDAAAEAQGRIRDREPEQRNGMVTIRFSIEEKAEIVAAGKARKLTVARLVAEAVFADIRGEMSVSAVRAANSIAVDELASARRDLAKVGGNLNQIAHRLNSGGVPHSADLVVVEAVRNAIAEVRRAVAVVDDAAHRAANRTAVRKSRRKAKQDAGPATDGAGNRGGR